MREKSDLGQGNATTIWQNPFVRKIVIACAALLIAFLLGFVPMWLRARDYANQLAQTQLAQKRLSIENTLAAAVINARRGEYEPARQAASNFYTSLRSELDNDRDSAFNTAQKTSFNQLFARRDETITLLARNDPAAADHLSEIYFSFRQILNASSVAEPK